MFRSIGILLLAAAFALPFAAANTRVDSAPASIDTRNSQENDCDFDGSAHEHHNATARVQVTQQRTYYADLQSGCTKNDAHYERHTRLFVTQTDNGYATSRSGFWWQDDTPAGGARYCDSWVVVGGATFYLGCPSPAGNPAPMFPLP